MKKLFVFLLCAAIVNAVADERTELLKNFAAENAAAEKSMQNSVTTVELVGSAGANWGVAESHLVRALDYKLRHTADAGERLKILMEFHELSREVQRVFDTPRKYMGSMAGMLIYGRIAQLLQHRTAVLMLDAEAEKRWKRLAGATIKIEGRKVELKQGRGKYTTGENKTFDVMIFPKYTFTWQNRVFAVFRTDIMFGVCDDYSTVWVYELKNGILEQHTKCDFPYFSKYILKGDELIFFDLEGKECGKIRL